MTHFYLHIFLIYVLVWGFLICWCTFSIVSIFGLYFISIHIGDIFLGLFILMLEIMSEDVAHLFGCAAEFENEISPHVRKTPGAASCLLCTKYTYEKLPRAKGFTADNREWTLVTESTYFCFYASENTHIMGCRGTVVTDIKDLWSDVMIASKAGCGFDRAKLAVEEATKYLRDHQGAELWTTGHSLGGATARCVAKALNAAKCIVFNPAAPPTHPVTNLPQETSFHIVLDVISAWMNGPNVVRIDMGFRPKEFSKIGKVGSFLSGFVPGVGQAVAAKELASAIATVLPTHGLANFFSTYGFILQKPQYETDLWRKWWKTLPLTAQVMISAFSPLITRANGFPPVDQTDSAENMAKAAGAYACACSKGRYKTSRGYSKPRRRHSHRRHASDVDRKRRKR